MMKEMVLLLLMLSVFTIAHGDQISEDQQKWVPVYERQANIPAPEDMLINSDPEPDLSAGFVSLYNGKDLDGWTVQSGFCTFEAQGDSIVGTCVKGSPSTYLSTNKNDYTDFVFSCEVKREVDGHTGVVFRAHSKKEGEEETVFGPKVYMEAFSKERFWSGGIYEQNGGGWYYPMWLDAHKDVRNAMKKEGWNRLTIKVQGETVKTWVNGLPAAYWTMDTYLKGFFSLQSHSGDSGEIHFRDLKVKELK